jgi:hypothetical protein
MRTILINLILLILLGVNASSCQTKKQVNNDTDNWRYEIEAVNTGIQGTYLIKVWSYSAKPEVAIEQAKKNAVHGIIFKGFAGKQGIPGQNPLATNSSIEKEKSSFFNEFFMDGGKYMKYVNLSNDGSVAAEDRLRIGREYKIGVLVSVNVTQLRKFLEDERIIKSLSSGF